MVIIALKDYPEWVLAYKASSREIRFLNGKYYLYEIHSKRIDGKVRKFTDRYLGKITEEGLIPPKDKEYEFEVKLYGLTAFYFSSCKNIIQSIINSNPQEYKKLLSLAILSYLFNNDLYEYNKHYFSIIFPIVSIKNEKKSIKDEVIRISNMMNHTITKTLKGAELPSFINRISQLYIVRFKDKWTIATYDNQIKEIIKVYNIEMEIKYGKD